MVWAPLVEKRCTKVFLHKKYKFTFACHGDHMLVYNILNYNHPMFYCHYSFFIHQANINLMTFQRIYALTFMCVYQGKKELGLLSPVKARVPDQPSSFWRARWTMSWCSVFRRVLIHISRPQGVKTVLVTQSWNMPYLSSQSRCWVNFIPREHKSSSW